jgi:hypothetical protein
VGQVQVLAFGWALLTGEVVAVSAISRRTLLRTGITLSAVAVPVVWAGSAAAAPAGRVDGVSRKARRVAASPSAWSRANFQPHLSKSFTLVGHSDKVTVTLAEIDNLLGSRPATAQHQFSLLFRAHRSAKLPEGLYTLRGAHFHPMTLFISPVDRGRKAQYVQAVVYRLA